MSQHVGAICLTRNGPKAVAKRLNGQNLWGMWLGSPLKPTKRISTDFGLRANWILRLWPCPHSSKSPQTSPVLHIKQGLVEDLAKYEKCMKHGSKWSSTYQLSGQRAAWPICFKDINILSYALNILCACWRHRERKHFSHCHKTWLGDSDVDLFHVTSRILKRSASWPFLKFCWLNWLISMPTCIYRSIHMSKIYVLINWPCSLNNFNPVSPFLNDSVKAALNSALLRSSGWGLVVPGDSSHALHASQVSHVSLYRPFLCE